MVKIKDVCKNDGALRIGIYVRLVNKGCRCKVVRQLMIAEMLITLPASFQGKMRCRDKNTTKQL